MFGPLHSGVVFLVLLDRSSSSLLKNWFFSKSVVEESGSKGSRTQGATCFRFTVFSMSFIFFHVKENETKENARKTLSSCASRSVLKSCETRCAQTVTALFFRTLLRCAARLQS